MNMKRRIGVLIAAAVLLVTAPTSVSAQTARAEAPIATAPPAKTRHRYSGQQIADLVAPVALYPDDLLAIVLPASTYPLQVVQAARFLDAAKRDRTRTPDADWDASIVALLNYPEVLKRLSDQLDWTVDLGQAVLRQQPEVLAAVAGFRKRAHAAGNLRSDDRQVVTVNAETVVIRSTDPSTLYVPDYDPTVVIVQRARPVVRYYPRAYPVYYYAYPPEHAFAGGWFWGVTTYFTLGWTSQRVYAYPWDDPFHPYYGRPWLYEPRHYYYRRPPKVVHNHYYGGQTDPEQGHQNGADRLGSGNAAPPRDDRTPWAGPADAFLESDDPVAVSPPASVHPPALEDPDHTWRPDYEAAGPRPGTERPIGAITTPSDASPMPRIAETGAEALVPTPQGEVFEARADEQRDVSAEEIPVSSGPAPLAAEALTTSQIPEQAPQALETREAPETPVPEYQSSPVEPAVGFEQPAQQYESLEPRYEDAAPEYQESAPRYEEPTPRFEQPAPRYEEPAPRYEEPAPRFEEPAPRYEAPTPVFERAEPPDAVSEGPAERSGWGGSGRMEGETEIR